MRISIPSIPEPKAGAGREHVVRTFDKAVEFLCSTLQRQRGRTLVMTGAGVSVDSGIAPYRGPNGHYTVHSTYRPIFFHEFVEQSSKGHAFRQRYWSRSFLGYPPVLHARPNKTHYSMAALQRLGYFHNIITQNVDSLHHAATPFASLAAESILELHGTLKNVVCVASPPRTSGHQHTVDASQHRAAPVDPSLFAALSLPSNTPAPVPYNTPVGRSAYPGGCGFRGSRESFQNELARSNPAWDAFAREMREHKREPKTNPDGDVELANDVDYSTFSYPSCPQCGGILKPAVVFFGESVPDLLRNRSFDLVGQNDTFVLVGSSLATYSAFRLVKAAQEQGKQTVIINRGPTRADPIVDDKIDIGSSEILHAVALRLAGQRAEKDAILTNLLQSGVTVLPERMRGVVSS